MPKPLSWETIREEATIKCIALDTITFDSSAIEIAEGTVLTGKFKGCTRDDDVFRIVLSFPIYYSQCLAIEPHLLRSSLVGAQYCFLCEKYSSLSDFQRHPRLADKSPILSQICAECYRRVKNRIEKYGSTARRHGGKDTLKVSEWLEKLSTSEGHCHYCQEYIGYAELITEHMTPLSLKGDNSIENVVPACMSCNSSKGGRDIETWQRSLEAKHLLETLQDHLGLSRYETINLAIKQLAIREGLIEAEQLYPSTLHQTSPACSDWGARESRNREEQV